MAAQSLADVLRCPHCGGKDIIYSCEPKCCFNHVCGDCRSTFEINTEKTGRSATSPCDFREPESGEPTTACASCESLKLAVFSADDAETLLLCGNCGALSRMKIEEFAPGFAG
jgi:transcription elongation factor Elf1